MIRDIQLHLSHERAPNHHPRQQASIPSQYKIVRLYAALLSGHSSSVELTASYNLSLVILPL